VLTGLCRCHYIVGCDAGPAPIIRDPVHPTIPCGYIPKLSHEHPCARPDKRLNSGDGSELFIVDRGSMMLNSPWPEGCERSDGCAWALDLVGETVTKTCCRGAFTHDRVPQASDCDVSSQTWCTRKNLCVPQNWQFRHATRILDVIMLDYPIQVRPMPGMWVQSVPVTAIPWGRMKTEQRNLVIRSIRKHD
jgi:hypothetical protein